MYGYVAGQGLPEQEMRDIIYMAMWSRIDEATTHCDESVECMMDAQDPFSQNEEADDLAYWIEQVVDAHRVLNEYRRLRLRKDW